MPCGNTGSLPPRSSGAVISAAAGGSTITARTAGPDALLLECTDGAHAAAVAAALLPRRAELGAHDVVAGATTVLVEGKRLRRSVIESAAAQAGNAPGGAAATVRLAVTFDGPDLPADPADREALAAALCARPWTVGFLGFAPGFGYLLRDDVVPGSPLYLPRHTEPRAHVPPGSVALAAGYAAVYPRPSPGGWHLIGTIAEPERLFDTETGALFQPGTAVDFHA